MSSMFNKTKAVSCPQSWDEYLEAASKLCPQIDGEYNYICVPNQNKTELVQFCFGSGRFPAWQLAEHCPYLHNTGNMNAENCTRFLYGCPEKHYMTKEIYKYQACLDINPERGCYVADSNCSKSLTSTVTPASTSPAAGNEVTIALSVVFGVIFCVLISVLISFIYMKKRGKYRKKKHKDKNCHPDEEYKRTENENVKLLGNSAENERETNNEPNMSLHEGGYISEKTSAKMMHFKDEINTKARAFYSACKNGNTDLCRYLLDRDPHILNQVDDDGWNAASCAAQGGNVEILELLAQKGVDMTFKSKKGSNILHIACMKSKLEMCQHIIQHYPDMLNQVNDDGCNVALFAAQGGNVGILELLAQKGVDMTLKSKKGSNILHIASMNSKSDMCQHIIQHYPDMLNQVNDDGWNVALFAAQGGNVEILELLEEKGVDMTFKDKNGSNILHIASMNSNSDMCQHIIQHYPDMLDQVDDNGCNVALYAAQGGNVGILELLAQKGVDMTFKDKEGCNILHIASMNSKSDMCQHIIQHYPDMLKQVDNDGWNVALYAAQGGNVGILELIAEKGVQLA
ncbi:putative ankyrin repeat protein RF_0381 [Saccostrea cucullata]|uniref:putative ankyrin repeat protein RF_0381 n=1 Tax=Saccostrea cuccullata TaxID=36930 RepID=UPI002ED29305